MSITLIKNEPIAKAKRLVEQKDWTRVLYVHPEENSNIRFSYIPPKDPKEEKNLTRLFDIFVDKFKKEPEIRYSDIFETKTPEEIETTIAEKRKMDFSLSQLIQGKHFDIFPNSRQEHNPNKTFSRFQKNKSYKPSELWETLSPPEIAQILEFKKAGLYEPVKTLSTQEMIQNFFKPKN